jgi:hypothetical protein
LLADGIILVNQLSILFSIKIRCKYQFAVVGGQLNIVLLAINSVFVTSFMVINSLFVRLISHQPAVLFSQNKPATINQPAVLFSHSKSAPAISHQPNEQTVNC